VTRGDIRNIKDSVIFILALLCFGVSIIMLPWSELGFNGQFPPWLACVLDPIGVAKMFGSIPYGHALQEFLTKQGARDNFGDYAYALFMFAALIMAAVAIVLIGREDAEEKTILPLKK
jgi:hypothetical protein